MSSEVTAIVDTGFTGELTLPGVLIDELELEYDAEVDAIRADGTVVRADTYVGIVEWDGVGRSTTVVAGEGAVLLGMLLMAGHILTVEIVEGGPVRVEITERLIHLRPVNLLFESGHKRNRQSGRCRTRTCDFHLVRVAL